eukprot:COSAG02_NODE_6627_length_3451_cov_1.639320_2_plen_61_part_00
MKDPDRGKAYHGCFAPESYKENKNAKADTHPFIYHVTTEIQATPDDEEIYKCEWISHAEL